MNTTTIEECPTPKGTKGNQGCSTPTGLSCEVIPFRENTTTNLDGGDEESKEESNDDEKKRDEVQHEKAHTLFDLLKIEKSSGYAVPIEKRLCSFANQSFLSLQKGMKAHTCNGENMASLFLHIVPKAVYDGANIEIGNYIICFKATREFVKVTMRRNDFEGSNGLHSDVNCRVSVAQDGCSLSIFYCAGQQIKVDTGSGIGISHLTRSDFLKQIDFCQIKNRWIDYLIEFQGKANKQLLDRDIHELDLTVHPDDQPDGVNLNDNRSPGDREERSGKSGRPKKETACGYSVLKVDCTIPEKSDHLDLESGLIYYDQYVAVEAKSEEKEKVITVLANVRSEWVEKAEGRNLELHLTIKENGTFSSFVEVFDKLAKPCEKTGKCVVYPSPTKAKNELMKDWENGDIKGLNI